MNITVDTVAVNAGKDTSVCINQQVMFKVQNVQSAYQYTWEPKADFQNPNGAVVTLLATQTKDYIVTATNSTGCSSSDTIHVDTDHSLQVELGADTTICSGGSHTILITTQNDVSTTYQWFPNNGVFDQSTLRYVVTPQQTTMYKVVAQNGTCTGVDSVLVTVQNGIDLAINSDTVVCSNTPFPIKVTSLQDSVEYRWIRGGTLDTMVDNPLIATPISKGIVQPTWYTVIATAKGCTSIDSFLITTHPAQVVKLSAERTVCVGDTIHVHVTADKITSVVWQPDVDITSISPTVVVITVNKEQTYSVTVCDSSGCCKVETYTTHIEPANQVTIGVVSIDSIAGRYATLYVVANGTTTINSGLQYDVEINADIFLPTPPSRITNKIRTIHRALGQTPITNAESIIDSIPGTLLMSEVLSSDVTIQNLVIDSVNCLQVIPNHGIIKVNSCADNIRAIKLFETLQAVITPNPVGSNAELHISSYVAGVCRYALYNQLGKEILRGSIDKNQQHIATTLHLP
ncbi:MAG: hypothetical protein JNJ85_07470, partial [Candidatus Kapabacteria bacterium]|nr:hypothetical protein [Candidatus Kapabacteria bacterium]